MTNRGGRLRLLGGKNASSVLDERHLHAEAGKNLRELSSDGAGADDSQPVRKLLQLEDAFVVEITRFSQSGHRRHHRFEAGSYNHRPGLDLIGSADEQLSFSDQNRLAWKTHFHAGLLEWLRAEAEHMVAHLVCPPDRAAPFDFRRADPDPVAVCVTDEMEEPRGPDQGLCWYAAVIGAGAPEVSGLREQNL